MPTSLLPARVLAVAKGIAWFVLLSHGGWGLIAGPMALVAAALSRSFPYVAVGLLLLPVAALSVSWMPILLSGSTQTSTIVVWLLLVIPALASAAFALIYRKQERAVKGL